MVINVLLALLVIGIIIFAHEFGHFIVAKANGITVVEFAIGFGPDLFHFNIGETKYSLKLLPFGGACVMLGNEYIESRLDEDDDDSETDDKTEDNSGHSLTAGYISEKAKQKAIECGYNMEKSFNSKPVWVRIAVIAAGPLFNFFLAFVLSIIVIGSVGYDPCIVDAVYADSPAYEAGLSVGDTITKVNGRKITFYRDYYFYRYYHADKEMEITFVRDDEEHTATIKPQYIKQSRYLLGITITPECVINTVSDDSAAEEAGIKVGDKVISINGTEVSDNSMVTKLISESDGNNLEVTVLRDGEKKTLNATPKLVETENYYTGFDCYGLREKVSPLETIKYSFAEVGYNVKSVVESLAMMFTGKVGINDLSGPVGAVSMMSDVVEQSKSDGAFYIFLNLVNLAVLISSNLGVMNLLPIPALDGGKLVFLLYEALRGKPVNKKYEGVVTLIGVIFLLILTVYLLFKDIFSLF